MRREAVVEGRKIRKTFGEVVALDDVDFLVQGGEIHGLLGENGAGKSTLMNILYGLYTPDAGSVFLNGKKVYEQITQRRFKADQESAKVSLKKGINSLLVKTANTRGPWKASLKFLDDEGRLIPGLRFVRELGED